MLKRILIGIAGLLSLLIVAAVVLAMRFDPNSYKDTLTAIVKEKKQRTLKIDGTISLAFWPKLGVALGKTSLSERGNENVFASIDDARLSLAVLPLLRKELVIDRIELSGVQATLVRDKNGRTNIDDLLAGDERAAPDQSAAAGAPMKFDIAGITLENTSLNLRDDKGGTRASLRKVELRTGRIAQGIPIDIRLQAEVDASQPKATGSIALNGGVQFDGGKGRYGIRKFDASVNGSGFGVRDLKLSLTGNAALDLPGERIETDDLKLVASGALDADQFNLTLHAPKLLISPQGASGSPITGNAKLGGARNAEVKFNASGISGNARAFALAKLALDFQFKEGQRNVGGELGTPLRGNLETRVFELPAITANVTVNDPTLPQKSIRVPLSGSARADLGKQSLLADLSASIDQSKLQGKFGVTGFATPAISVDAGIDQINVDRYLPVAAKGDALPAGSAAPEKPIDLGFLKTLNLNASLRVGTLQMQGIKATGLAVVARAANGRLDVPTVTANLYQGTLAGSASASASNQFTLRQNLNNIAIGPFMKDALNRDLLEGRGNVVIDVAGNGASVAQIKKSLGGSGSIRLRDGAIKGINLAQTLRDFKSKIGLQKNEAQSADRTAKTDFTELSATFAIRNGVASNNDLSLKSPFLRMGGAGDIDIGQNSMNYLAKATIVNTSSGQGGKDLAQLKDLSIPVRIFGPFEKLNYEVQWLAISSDVLKNTVKDKLMERLTGSRTTDGAAQGGKPAQETPQDILKNQLKGLFGR